MEKYVAFKMVLVVILVKPKNLAWENSTRITN